MTNNTLVSLHDPTLCTAVLCPSLQSSTTKCAQDKQPVCSLTFRQIMHEDGGPNQSPDCDRPSTIYGICARKVRKVTVDVKPRSASALELSPCSMKSLSLSQVLHELCYFAGEA